MSFKDLFKDHLICLKLSVLRHLVNLPFLQQIIKKPDTLSLKQCKIDEMAC